MSDRKLTDAYWMDKGAAEERAKILEELHQLLSNEVKDVAGDMDRARGIEMAIDSIKGNSAYGVTPSAEIELGVAALELGVLRERKRIIALLEDNTCRTCESGDLIHRGCEGNLDAVALIKGDPLKELQRLAEETGEYENFDNPLIDEKEKKKAQEIIDLLGIIGK